MCVCRCIEEPGLADYIRENASHKECAYGGKQWKKARAVPLDDVVQWIRHRIEAEYEDPANGVGYETAKGGYQLATTDTWDHLDELGLEYDLTNEDLRQHIFDEMGMESHARPDGPSLGAAR
jgi:HEPN/RES N-terminal domain 1